MACFAPAGRTAAYDPKPTGTNVTGDPITANELLTQARAKLRRLTPRETQARMADGLRLVDIRSDAQRDADGLIPGAVYVPRNVLEWRLDPACRHRDPELARANARVALICDEGYQSSLAAATIARFGLAEVTDVVGGFRAWRAAGLPVEPRQDQEP
jgi:rhodanese-related sulfurtransferase